ncbi:MAG: hypothetical protein Kow00109_19770 [Acidobacteriota bacterium]
MIELIAVELRKLIHTFRLPALAFGAVLLWLLSGHSAGVRYRTDLESYDRNVNLELERIERVREAGWHSQFIVQFLLPPARSALLLDAGAQYLPDVVAYEIGQIDRVRYSSTLRYNFALPRFLRLDWTFILLYVMSFGALTLSFDLVSGERERGTLRLLLSYPVRRAVVLGGKFFAVMLSLWVVILLGSVGSLLVFVGETGVSLEGADLVAIGIWWLAAVLYLGAFVAVGMLFSTACRNSPQALYWSLAAWVILVLGVPAASQVAAEVWRPALRTSEVDRMLSLEAAKQIAEVAADPSRANWDAEEWRRRIAEMYNRQLRSAFAQVELAERLSLVSPNGLFLAVMARTLRAGVYRLEDFIAETWLAVRQYAEAVEREGTVPAHPLLQLRSAWERTRIVDPPWSLWLFLAAWVAAAEVLAVVILVRSDIE